MANKDKDMLSFEELRKKLGIDEKTDNDNGESKPQEEIIPSDVLENMDVDTGENSNKESKENIENLVEEIDKSITKQVEQKKEKKNDSTKDSRYTDVTDLYVNKKEQKDEEPVEKVVVPEKKKRKTFNEMFSSFSKKAFPNKEDTTKEKIRKTIMNISIVVIIGCIIGFGELYRQRLVELKLEEDLKNQIITDVTGNDDYDKWNDVVAKYPNIKFPEGMNIKYSYLYAINQDLVGWLKIPNTNLDVQVVKAKDNDFYHRRNFYKNSSRYGCPYMDCRNDSRYLSDNTIIYGHHMPDGLMFSNLDKYKTLEGYKESPIIQFDTLYDSYEFKIFACFITNINPESDNGQMFNYMVPRFSTDASFNGFVEEAKKKSIIDTGVDVQPDDKILTLATCTYDFSNARFVVMGRLLRPNESNKVDTSKASLNPSPKYPQAWYDAKGLTNPYKDDKTWTYK